MQPVARHGESGVALIAVVLILALLLGLAAALTTSINMDTGLRGAYQRSTAGFYAAESGLNRGMGDYRNIFLNFNTPYGADFAQKTITVGARTVDYKITDVTAYDSFSNPPSKTIPPGQVFGGLNSIEYDYIDSAVASSNSNVEARVNAEFKVGNIPLFQFIAFYAKDLEIAPGANMNLIGRVHTNGDLYLSADSALLSIVDDPATGVNTVQVSAKGKIFRGRKRSTTCDAGQVSVAQLADANKDGRLDQYGLNCSLPDSVSPSSSSGSTREALASELSTWKGSMINHVESVAVPLPDIGARGTGVYWTRADLRIVLNLTRTWKPSTTAGTYNWPWPTSGAGSKPLPYSIEVQDVAGNVDTAKTNALTQFMLGTDADEGSRWNCSNSSVKRTMPIYYTDVPTTCTDANATTCTNNQLAGAYTIPFATTPASNPPSSPVTTPTLNDNRVYATTNTVMFTMPNCSTASFDVDYRRGGFYNWREGKWMYLLNVNLQDLLRWNMQMWNTDHDRALFDPSDKTDGGLVIFLSVQGPESNNVGNPTVPGSGSRYGVRIFGSEVLPFPNVGADPSGVNIVSDHALFVAGDFNAPNGAAGPNLLANGWQPAALMGDTLNVLSNAWFSEAIPPPAIANDKQSNLAMNPNRLAQATTINAALLAGVDDTIVGGGTAGYNGGLENYPRFHEQWGVPFNYRGSFVSLGTPAHVSGKWTTQSYSAPQRNWNFDTQFNNAANLPPLTPRFVYVQQVLFTEEFK